MSDTWKTVKPYFNGGMSGMLATCCIQPIDMVKVRIQLGATGSPIGIASQIIKEEGFGSLYKGLVSRRSAARRLVAEGGVSRE